MACPASIRMSEGIPSRSSVYADEGTAAHQLAERCLRERQNPWRFIGQTETVNGQPWEITEEMAEAVQVFIDCIRGPNGAMQEGDHLLIERRFDLSSVHPGMFGTNDACVISPSRRTLFVFDYKHGKGHAVEARGNPQLRYYGLGALLNAAGGGGIERLVLTIVQPRAPHRDGPIRSEEIDILDLLDWAGELKRAAVATEDPFAPLAAGDHCLFCPASAVCPALQKRALTEAAADFDGADIRVPADPSTLSMDQIVRVLNAADLIDGWVAAVRAHALHLAESGTEVPGYKLVPKRATRRWRDEAEVPTAEAVLHVPHDDLYVRKLKSPAQIEKLLPRERRHLLEPLVEKISSGVNLVRDDDARPAQAPSAIADFSGVSILDT